MQDLVHQSEAITVSDLVSGERQFVLDLGIDLELWRNSPPYQIWDSKSERYLQPSRNLAVIVENHIRFLFIRDEELLINIPDSISNLTELAQLEIICCPLQRFPLSLCSLINLRHLLIYRSAIRSIPPEINQMSQLRSFTICQTPIQEIPSSIGSLSNLQELNFSENLLSFLPDTLSHCQHLRILNVGSNFLSSLPPSLKNIPFLNYINIGMNHFQTIPNWVLLVPNKGIGRNPFRSLHNFKFHSDGKFYLSIIDPLSLPDKIRQLVEKARIYGMDYEHDPTKAALFDDLMAQLETYYALSTMDLAAKFVSNGKLSDDEWIRLVHEATFEERDYLESHLSVDHPLLKTLNQRLRIEGTDFSLQG
ncbi:leucine-rich repeat domain-containing protein [Candidatus Lokiarchaeum ossiferum]|uniref:leucine-rich repeat domain-containing protein n=1 Tax=Candidatus Lokiarchaeum ossiferum TaxID=2951803 RepID=UPI00352C4FAB